jgi:AcrR family transcriptional regulator
LVYLNDRQVGLLVSISLSEVLMNEKRRLLVNTAFQLFYERGINSVGINEILKVSGIAKKTLYANFDSKDDLVLETLAERDAAFLNWLGAELHPCENNVKVINVLFSALTKWFYGEVPALANFRGCYFIKTSGECSDAGRIFHYCVEHKQKVRALIAQHLTCVDDSVIDQVCLLKEGAIVTAYLNHDLKAAEKCIPMALKLIDPQKANG